MMSIGSKWAKVKVLEEYPLPAGLRRIKRMSVKPPQEFRDALPFLGLAIIRIHSKDLRYPGLPKDWRYVDNLTWALVEPQSGLLVSLQIHKSEALKEEVLGSVDELAFRIVAQVNTLREKYPNHRLLPSLPREYIARAAVHRLTK